MSPLPPAVRVRLRVRALALLASAIPLLPIAGARTLTAQGRAAGALPTLVRAPAAAGVRTNVGARDTLARQLALERALGAARRQERSGRAMVLAGVAGVVGSSATWVRGGRMGMSGGQAAIFTGSTGIAVAGAARWIAARTHAERARGTRARADVAAADRSP